MDKGQLGFQLLPQNPWPSNNYPIISPQIYYSLYDAVDVYQAYKDPGSPEFIDPADYYSSSSDIDYSAYPLFIDACQSNDSTTYDCYSRCNGSAFQDLPHLATCSSISLLADIKSSKYFYNVTDPLNVPVVSASGRSTGKRVATPNLADLAESTSELIWNCLAKKCESLDDCRPNLADYDTGVGYATKLRVNGSSLAYVLCGYLPQPLDNDIGGIGVYISYWIHSSMVLLLFIICLLFKGVDLYFSKWNTAKSQEWMGVFVKNRLSSLNSGLAEFHKAQCFFTLAINIAAIKVFKRGGLDPKTLEQLYNNYIFTKIIAISGYLPVSLTLLSIHLIHETSWFLIFLAAVSFGLAIGTLSVLGQQFTPTPKDFAKLSNVYNNPDTPDFCQSKSPWAYCYTDFLTYSSGIDLNTMAYQTLGFCLVVMVCLIVGKLKKDHKRSMMTLWRKTQPARDRVGNNPVVQRIATPIDRVWHSTTAKLFRRPRQRTDLSTTSSFSYNVRYRVHNRAERRGHSYFVYEAFKVLIYALFIGLYGWFFSIYFKALKIFANKDAYSNTWSFGQVVALLVWVPPIIEYAHCEMQGIQRAFDHRLMPPYHVTKYHTEDSPLNADEDVEYGSTGGDAGDDRVVTAQAAAMEKFGREGEESGADMDMEMEMTGGQSMGSTEGHRHGYERRNSSMQRLELDFDTDTEYRGRL